MFLFYFNLQTRTNLSDVANSSARFNQRATRLLCIEFQSAHSTVCYNVPSEQQQMGGVNGKVRFSSKVTLLPSQEENLNCFAGRDDELVVAASDDHSLFVWPLPTDGEMGGDQVVDQSLVVLRGHKDIIFSVCYNRQSDTLASAGGEKVIKLWEPIAQQQ